MSKFTNLPVKNLTCILLAGVLSMSGLNMPEGKKVSEKSKVSTVYDEIQKSNISNEELNRISEAALVDGSETAEKINNYKDSVDYEAALNYAMTSYYKTENFAEMAEFEKTIDDRSTDIINGYKEAAIEREAGDSNGYETGTLLMSFDKKTSMEEIEAIVEAEYGECRDVIELYNGDKVVIVDISLGHTVDMAEDAFYNYSIVETADSNDYDVFADVAGDYVNEPRAKDQYYLDNMNVKNAWDYIDTNGGEKVIVGVIDSGVQTTHYDLANVLSPKSAAVYGDGNPVLLSELAKPYDDTHGTRVAGIIAAEANNNVGIAGVASCYDNDVVEILAVKATKYSETSKDYTFPVSYVIEAINYCVEQGAKVINYSASGTSHNATRYKLLTEIKEAGVIFVCAAGNNCNDAVRYPSDYINTISIVATTKENTLADFSGYGQYKDFAAPGNAMLTTSPVGTVASPNGTSFSSPAAAAVIAMMCSQNSELNFDSVYEILSGTAVDIGLGDKCKNGLINAYEAVKAARNYGNMDTNGADSVVQEIVTEIPTTPSAVEVLEVIGAVVSSPADNTVAVVWGQDSQRIEKKYKYNVYVNGEKKLSLVDCNYYTIPDVSAGIANVKITSVYNGVESAGVSYDVVVNGIFTEAVTTTVVQETTVLETTTIEETTTEEVTTEENTTEKTTVNTEAVPQTTAATVEVLEVIGAVVSSPADNTVAVVWGQDSERIEKKYKYNVYVNNEKKLSLVECNYYTVSDVNAGTAVVRLTAVYNGVETEGVSFEVTVKGNVIEETTTVQQTKEPITVTPSTDGMENIAEGKATYSSSSENNSLAAGFATDGDDSTRWSSAWTDNEWIYVDLGASKYVSYVDFVWEAAHAKTYEVLISEDGENWTKIATFVYSSGGTESIGINRNARFVKMQGVTRSTTYGYSLYEMRVFGY